MILPQSNVDPNVVSFSDESKTEEALNYVAIAINLLMFVCVLAMFSLLIFVICKKVISYVQIKIEEGKRKSAGRSNGYQDLDHELVSPCQPKIAHIDNSKSFMKNSLNSSRFHTSHYEEHLKKNPYLYRS